MVNHYLNDSAEIAWLKLMAEWEQGYDEPEPHQVPQTDEQLLEKAA
jgi:hypothetical protein